MLKDFCPAQSNAPEEEPISIYTKILNIPQANAVLDAWIILVEKDTKLELILIQ